MCISVAAADSLYTAEDFLLTHNTLNDSFIILDEAQNTSAEQMKMFLTRLGFGSQWWSPATSPRSTSRPARSAGCAWSRTSSTASRTSISRLTSHDVVRHRLVGKIVDAYERYDAHERQLSSPRQPGRRRRKGS